MADPQPQDASSSPSPDIGSILGTDKSAVDDLIGVQKQKTATDAGILAQADKKLDADAARVEKAFAAEGVGHDELKPWDANKEHKKFKENPIEGFGSVGGLFAMVASAFTKAPMTNAINGMAGAINSIKEGNEAAYNRAHESWKENTKLALDRFKMQHELYQDALSLMDHNTAAASAKLHNAAVRFGDQQTLVLAEHGMVKEIYELQEARAKSAASMEQMVELTTKATFQRAAVRAIAANPPNTGDLVQDKIQLAAQVQRVFDGQGKYGTAEQEAVGRYVQKNINEKDSQKFVDGLADIHQQFSPKAANIEGYQTARQAEMDANGGVISPEKDADLLTKFGLSGRPGGVGPGGNRNLTNERVINVDAEEYKKRMAAEHPDWSQDKLEKERDAYVKRREIATQKPTATLVMKADEQYQKAERMETAMDEMDELLLKHKFITGLGGTLTRPIEAFSNVLGSNATDRKQFQRVATELKEWGISVLNDRSGRPLSSEAKDAAVIFAGLNPQDTGANTIRAIAELRPVIKTIKEQIKARGQGQGPVSGGSDTPPPAKDTKPGSAPWLNDPVKE